MRYTMGCSLRNRIRSLRIQLSVRTLWPVRSACGEPWAFSTHGPSGSISSPQWCVFKVSRLTCRHVLLVFQSSVCLASSSGPLRPYVFFPNKHHRLASYDAPCSKWHGINHLSHMTGPVFYFHIDCVGFEPTTIAHYKAKLYH